MNTNANLSLAALNQFTGSENWYRHCLNPKVMFTDGAKFVADQGGAYWLLDEIACAQRYDRDLARQPFQVWKLEVRPDHSATLTVEDGDYKPLYSRALEFTDFPMTEVTLWFSNNVIYLPSEH